VATVQASSRGDRELLHQVDQDHGAAGVDAIDVPHLVTSAAGADAIDVPHLVTSAAGADAIGVPHLVTSAAGDVDQNGHRVRFAPYPSLATALARGTLPTFQAAKPSCQDTHST